MSYHIISDNICCDEEKKYDSVIEAVNAFEYFISRARLVGVVNEVIKIGEAKVVWSAETITKEEIESEGKMYLIPEFVVDVTLVCEN
jgi:hypothetical protein